MSTINTGKRRSLTIDVVRYEDSVIIYTTTYDGLLAFNSYPTITLSDLALMSENQYLQRLDDFTKYVGTLEPNADFLSNLNDPYGDSISCNPIISYQGIFDNFNCEIDATAPTFDYTFEIIGVSSTNQGYNSTTYDDLILKTGLLSNTPAQEKYIYSIGFRISTTLDNTAIPPEFDIVFTGLDGVRYDYSLFNLKVDAGNTHIVEKTGVNLYGNNGVYIKQVSNVVTFKPEVDLVVFMSGMSITKNYAIRFAPYILGNLLVDKNIRVSITPRNSNGNYFYNFIGDNFVDLGFKYTNSVSYCDITPLTLQSTDTLSITNNGTANTVKIYDSSDVLKATIPITPNSGLTQIPLTSYSLTGGDYSVKLYNPNNTIYKSININITANILVKYGYLYNGYVYQDTRKITSSDDWKVSGSLYYPTDDISLLQTFTGNDTSGLKDNNPIYWNNLIIGTTNAYGFSARGNGFRFVNSGNIDIDNTFFLLGDQFILGEAGGWGGQTRFNDHDSIFGHGSGFNDDIGAAMRLTKSTTTLTHGQSGTYVGNDGTIYPTICINGIEWLACNLAETEYRNHDVIPNAISNTVWYGYGQTSTGVLCAYGNDINNVFI